MTATDDLSDRLKDAIALYCHHVDSSLVESLVGGMKLGALDWFVDEFADAIRTGKLTPAIWGKLTETDLDDDDFAEADKDLRFVWSRVAPDRPFPADVPRS